MKNKKAMIGNMISLAIGIILIAVITTIGIVVLGNFATSQAACQVFAQDSSKTTTFNATTGTCDSGYYCTTVGGGAATFNASNGYCQNATANLTSGNGVANPFSDSFTASIGARSAYYAEGKLGNGTGGLLTWLPVLIPALIGIGIIGYFMTMRVKA